MTRAETALQTTTRQLAPGRSQLTLMALQTPPWVSACYLPTIAVLATRPLVSEHSLATSPTTTRRMVLELCRTTPLAAQWLEVASAKSVRTSRSARVPLAATPLPGPT